MKTTYTFTVLRYVHDITTGEFANVGVALFAPEAKYLGAICTPRYGRLTRIFLDIKHDDIIICGLNGAKASEFLVGL